MSNLMISMDLDAKAVAVLQVALGALVQEHSSCDCEVRTAARTFLGQLAPSRMPAKFARLLAEAVKDCRCSAPQAALRRRLAQAAAGGRRSLVPASGQLMLDLPDGRQVQLELGEGIGISNGAAK